MTGTDVLYLLISAVAALLILTLAVVAVDPPNPLDWIAGWLNRRAARRRVVALSRRSSSRDSRGGRRVT